jgi:hypothetical protein
MKNERMIILPEDTVISQEVIKEVDELFRFTSPTHLRKSINVLFLSYLMNVEPEMYPDNFRNIAEDIFFLQSFLDNVVEHLMSGYENNQKDIL